MPIKIFNTLSRKKEIFKPIKNKQVGIYACGPTVYDYAHIGNLRTFIFEDILKRTLLSNGYIVKHIMNITDVGHLVSDEDSGEDKMIIGARREKLSIADIAKKYFLSFKKDIDRLNILKPDVWCWASKHIKEQIALIKNLEKKGFTYKTTDGVYFNTAKFSNYGKIARLDIKGLKPGARVKFSREKINPTDFALWKFSPKNQKRLMEWESPWGIGFPGWHIECSAMSMKYLGNHFDIHCGGVDHIPVHHTNEIAQSEAATGEKYVNYWIHGEHLLFNGKKMSKSKGNYATLKDIIDRGYHPLAFRYLVLTTHYRSKINFTWESMKSAQNFLINFYDIISEYDKPANENNNYIKIFKKAINDDLNTPKALAITQKLIKSDLPSGVKKATLLNFDKILGLDISDIKSKIFKIPSEIKSLLKQRENARENKDWKRADMIRKNIIKMGYIIEDTKKGQKIKKL